MPVMSRPESTPRSYYALRVCPDAAASPWWASARHAGSTAPRAIRAILAGRSRVELTADEAGTSSRGRASCPDGMTTSLAPLQVYPSAPIGS
jgi:hypothetical protein